MTQPKLKDGETPLWEGKPYGGVVFTSVDIFFIPLSFVWALMATGILFSGDARSFNPIDFISVAISFYITIGRFIFDILRRRSTHYFLSDQRAIVETRFPFKRERTKRVTEHSDIEALEGRRLNVWFGERPSFFMSGQSPLWGGGPGGFVFEQIEDKDGLRAALDRLQY